MFLLWVVIAVSQVHVLNIFSLLSSMGGLVCKTWLELRIWSNMVANNAHFKCLKSFPSWSLASCVRWDTDNVLWGRSSGNGLEKHWNRWIPLTQSLLNPLMQLNRICNKDLIHSISDKIKYFSHKSSLPSNLFKEMTAVYDASAELRPVHTDSD